MRIFIAVVLGLIISTSFVVGYQAMLPIFESASRVTTIGIALVVGLGIYVASQPRAKFVLRPTRIPITN